MTDSVTDTLSNLQLSNLSKRGAKTASGDDFMCKYLTVASNNPYHPTTNTKGIINMGTAVNRLMERELQERLTAPDVLRFNPLHHQHYFDFTGTQRCKEALSHFLQRHLSGGRPVPANQLVVLNGVTSCLDSLAHALCDEGDVLVTPTPVYGRIFTDFQDRANVDVQPLYLLPKDVGGTEEDFELRPERLEERVLELAKEGKRVKAFILLNPQNPLGEIYSGDLVKSLLKVCATYEIHAIVDEIYALSLYENSSFQSVLALDDLPDPQRTHFLWGMSKDFGLAGVRVGVVHSRDTELLQYLAVVSNFQVTPSIIHDAVATLLMDTKWCDEMFLPTSRLRLSRSFEFAQTQLKAAGVHVHSSKAGLFAWINITPFMKELTEQEELVVFEELMDAGVYVVPGSILHCRVPGWFRLIVSVSEEELRVGLERLVSVLQSRLKKQSARQ